jgi:hypothetical protein
MEINKLRSIIKEAVKEVHLKEIEAVAENAAMEARLAEYDKAIKACENKIATAENLEEIQEFIDENKINEVRKRLKNLKKEKEKIEKAKAKKNNGKKVVTDEPTEEPAVEEGNYYNEAESDDAAHIDALENDMEDDAMNNEVALNESFLKMQKLAGVITETQYNQKKSLIENQLNENKIGDIIKKVFSKAKKQEDKPVDNKIIQQADAIAAQAEQEAAKKKKEEDLAKFTAELDKNQRLQELLEAYLEIMHDYDSQERFNDLQYGIGSFEPDPTLQSSLTNAKNKLYDYSKSRGIDPESISSIFYSLQGALKKAKEATKARYNA